MPIIFLVSKIISNLVNIMTNYFLSLNWFLYLIISCSVLRSRTFQVNIISEHLRNYLEYYPINYHYNKIIK